MSTCSVPNSAPEVESAAPVTDPQTAIDALTAIMASYSATNLLLDEAIVEALSRTTGAQRKSLDRLSPCDLRAVYAHLLTFVPNANLWRSEVWHLTLLTVAGDMSAGDVDHAALAAVASAVLRRPITAETTKKQCAVRRAIADAIRTAETAKLRDVGKLIVSCQPAHPNKTAAQVRDVLAENQCFVGPGGRLVVPATDDVTGVTALKTMNPTCVMEFVHTNALVMVPHPKIPGTETEGPLPKGIAEMVVANPDWAAEPGTKYLCPPPVVSVVSRPVITPTGRVVHAGYDAETRTFVAPTKDIETLQIPDDPTPQDVEAARDVLLDLVQDFPFLTALDRAVWLATVLTIVGRQLIDGPVPLIAFSANSRGTGKTTLATLAQLIADGGCPPVSDWPATNEEMGKRITAVVIAGRPAYLFDNITATVEVSGGSIEAATTSTQWSGRILGESRSADMPMRTVWLATGNQMCVSGDMGRRVLMSKLLTDLENPEARDDFAIADLEGHVRQHRAAYLGAALTILLAHQKAGCPRNGALTQGSYAKWCEVVAGAVCGLGLDDPTKAFVSRRGDVSDPTDDAYRTILESWPGTHTVAHVLDDCAPMNVNGVRVPHAFDPAKRQLAEAFAVLHPKFDLKKIGMALGTIVDRKIGGMTLRRSSRLSSGTRSKMYYVERPQPAPAPAAEQESTPESFTYSRRVNA